MQENIIPRELRVEVIHTNWALVLMTKGVIVNLDIKRWNAEVKLDPELLGLKFEDDDAGKNINKYYKFGTHRIFPLDVINDLVNVSNRARENLYYFSYDTVWGRFVPYTAFNEWEKENNIIRNDYYNIARKISENYYYYVQCVKDDYKIIAKDVWKRLYPESNDAPDSFTEDFAIKIVSKIPLRDDLISKLSYNHGLYTIPLPSFFENEMAKINAIKRNEELEDHKLILEKEIKEKIANNYVEKKKEIIDGFLNNTVGEIRKYLNETCENILKGIEKNNKINIASINKINKMIKRVKLLNFYNDKKLDKKLDDLGYEINKFKDSFKDEDVIIKLKEVFELSNQEFSVDNLS